MAKRAKAAAKRAKTEKVEPFFRPFSKLGAAPAKKADAGPHPRPLPPPPPPRREEPPPPEPVDPQTFALYMAGVTALPEGRAGRIPLSASRLERAPRAAPAEDLDAEARARMRSLVTEGLRFETLDDGEVLSGRRLDVEPRELRRLRRGQFATDGKLDLHGLGADEARQAVEAFVKKRAVEGDKVVLIVHGKGSHSPRGRGVLRGEIAAWLSQGRAARHVAAFATAPEEQGGAGAVLVLLAR
jgi:DNA-nicking Smr family endonuclease